MRLPALVGLCPALMTGSLAAQAGDAPLRLAESFYAKSFDDETLPMTQRLQALHAQPLVEVRFRLFARDKECELHYVLTREGGRWLVADIRYLTDNVTLAGLFRKGAKGG